MRYGQSTERVLVVPANADAQRSALLSGYVVKQPIEETFREVRDIGRPIIDLEPPAGDNIDTFVAGPERGEDSRFGQTRYYRHPNYPQIR